MKSKMIFVPLIPALLLSACGKNDDVAATPANPNDPSVVLPHNVNECPTNLDGRFVHRGTGERKLFRVQRQGPRASLTVEDRDGLRTFELSGRTLPLRARGVYRGSCHGGIVSIQTFTQKFRSQELELVDKNDIRVIDSGVAMRRYFAKSNETTEYVFEREQTRPSPQPSRRPTPPRRGR